MSEPALPKLVVERCAAIAMHYMTPDHPKGDNYTRELQQAMQEANYEQAKETSVLLCMSMVALNHPMAARCIILWEDTFGDKKEKPDAAV